MVLDDPVGLKIFVGVRKKNNPPVFNWFKLRLGRFSVRKTL